MATLLMPCAGCCWVGCDVRDLAFVSLTPARSRATGAYLSPIERPDTLKLEFSTRQNLVRFAEDADARWGTYVRVARCSGSPDPDTFISHSLVYYGPDALDVSRYGVSAMMLRPSEDGHFTYEGFVGIDREFIPVRTLGLSYVPRELPRDLRQYPDLCFELIGAGFISHFGSNKVHIPREAVAKVLAPDRLPPGS